MIATDYPHSDAIDKFPDKTVGAISGNDKIAARIAAQDPLGQSDQDVWFGRVVKSASDLFITSSQGPNRNGSGLVF